MSHPVVFRPLQARFLTVPEAPFVYWVTHSIVDLLASSHILGQRAEVRQGMATTDNARFLRFSFEVPAESAYWVPYVKGGRYQKWAGLELLNVNWREDGKVLKNAVLKIPTNKHWSRRIASEDKYFAPGLTYTILGRGSVGIRFHERSIFDVHGTSIFPYEIGDRWYLAGVLNARLASYLLRIISHSLVLHAGYIARFALPACEALRQEIQFCARSAFALKSWLVSEDLIERSFAYRPPPSTTLTESWRLAADAADAVAAVLHTLEGFCEREVFAAYGIAGEDLQAILDETGTPAGWFPLVAGYEAPPELPGELVVEPELLERLFREQRCTPSPDALADLKRRLRTLYEARPGAQVDAETAMGEGDENDAEEQEAAVSGARIPIPTETFLEELSQKLEVHPISVYWLLRELRKEEGVVSLRELRRYVEEYFTVMILRLLGHRWPKEIEAGEPIPEWADPDGIIPLTDGTGERTLLDRVRERIAAEFGEGRVDAIEQEFRQIIGCSLADWLARDFFPHHLSQFKRRPIAWLLESGRALDTRWAAASSRRGRRSTRAGGPAFACLVYYHKLTADTLSRLKTHYLRPVLQRREFELAEERRRAAEGDVGSRAAAERAEGGVDELKAFEAALDTVSAQGFWSRRLTDLLGHEAADHWARRTPKGAMPDQEAFLRQEQAYDPDLNDGVRVNIAAAPEVSLAGGGCPRE